MEVLYSGTPIILENNKEGLLYYEGGGEGDEVAVHRHMAEYSNSFY